MEIQKREGTRIISNHALDTIGNPSEACLAPSRPNLTSYALELLVLWCPLEPYSVRFAVDKRN